MTPGRRAERVDMYCHMQTCDLYNEKQIVRWLPSDFEEPAEWMDDPECRWCHSELREQPHETEEVEE